MSSLTGSTTGVTLSGNTATVTGSNLPNSVTFRARTSNGKESQSVTFNRMFLLNPVSSNSSYGTVTRSTDAAVYN